MCIIWSHKNGGYEGDAGCNVGEMSNYQIPVESAGVWKDQMGFQNGAVAVRGAIKILSGSSAFRTVDVDPPLTLLKVPSVSL